MESGTHVGWTGSTIGGFSRASGTDRPRRSNRRTIANASTRHWPRDSNEMASGKPGTLPVHRGHRGSKRGGGNAVKTARASRTPTQSAAGGDLLVVGYLEPLKSTEMRAELRWGKVSAFIRLEKDRWGKLACAIGICVGGSGASEPCR